MPERRLSTPYFDCLPHQIFALRKCIGWTRKELAAFMVGNYQSIKYWETGKYRPQPYFRDKLVHLAEMFKLDYLRWVEKHGGETEIAKSIATRIPRYRPLSPTSGRRPERAEQAARKAALALGTEGSGALGRP